MPGLGDDDEEPPFRPIDPEKEQALRERIERQKAKEKQAEKKR